MNVLTGAALIVLFVFVRRSALTVQDRLIRLEMCLRLAGELGESGFVIALGEGACGEQTKSHDDAQEAND